MSAYIVNRKHIDRIVAGALAFGAIDLERADNLGRTLWVENLRSVAARYPSSGDGERPGPCGLSDAEIKAYTYTAPHKDEVPGAGALSKLLNCLDYQSCETNDWNATEAFSRINDIRSALGRSLPGYEEEPWG